MTQQVMAIVRRVSHSLFFTYGGLRRTSWPQLKRTTRKETQTDLCKSEKTQNVCASRADRYEYEETLFLPMLSLQMVWSIRCHGAWSWTKTFEFSWIWTLVYPMFCLVLSLFIAILTVMLPTVLSLGSLLQFLFISINILFRVSFCMRPLVFLYCSIHLAFIWCPSVPTLSVLGSCHFI